MADPGEDERLLLLLWLSFFSFNEDVCNGTTEGEGCGYGEYFEKGKVKANLEILWENFVRQKESSTFGMLSVLYFGLQIDCSKFERDW